MGEELYLYEAFHYTLAATAGADQHLKLRFRKVPHGLILKEKKSAKSKKKSDFYMDEEAENPVVEDKVRRLRPFQDVSGYSGVRKLLLTICVIVSTIYLIFRLQSNLL